MPQPFGAWQGRPSWLASPISPYLSCAGREGGQSAGDTPSVGSLSARAGGCALDLGQCLCFGHTGVGQLEAVAQRVKALLHPSYAFEQTGVDEGRNGLAILLDQDAVVAVLDDIEHFAQVLTEGDGAGLGDHAELP